MRIRDLMAAAVAAILFTTAAYASDDAPKAPKAVPKSAKVSASTADHTKFKELDRDFASGPDVTKACLSCHTEASNQLHKTQHWSWEFNNPQTGQKLGKRHVINNFCTSIESNQGACATCHIGYGVMANKPDLSSQDKVDCLACHDTTGKFAKPGGLGGNVFSKDIEFPPGSGKVIRGIDLKEIAQNVGKTSRRTCGNCHFKGGGGDGVKHGDLDSTLEAPEKDLDVHMDVDGLNFTCATCHKTEKHQVPGSRYNPTAFDKDPAHIRGKDDGKNPATCAACHGQAPHQAVKLNEHTAKIACATCHIPAYARGGIPTKMFWDWSTAGRKGKDGKFITERDDDGYETYMTIKGDFTWKENVIPEYVWFNGVNKYTLISDKLEKADQPIKINHFEGSATDGKSMIWPVKIFRGKQQYDPENKSLVLTHLAGADDTAFWTNLNWEKAVAAGSAAGGVKFSGKVDFIETESMWHIAHMVAPKEKALGCADCHASKGRLEAIDGVYMPGRGRDHNSWLEILGWLMAAGTLVGVSGHGLIRYLSNKRNK